jgi:hypothetical protein
MHKHHGLLVSIRKLCEVGITLLNGTCMKEEGQASSELYYHIKDRLVDITLEIDRALEPSA